MKKFFSLFLVLFLSFGMIGLVGCNGLWDFDDDDDVSIVPVNFKFTTQINMGAATNNLRAAAIDPTVYSANVYYEDDSTTALNGTTPVTANPDGTFTFDFNAYDGRTFYVVFTHNTNANALKLYRYFKKTKAQMDAYTTAAPAVVNETTTAVGIYLQQNNGTKKYGTDVDETTSNADVTSLAGTITTYVGDATATDFVIPVTEMTINQTGPVNVEFGKTTTLTATVLPSYATEKTVTWSSSDATIATVDANTGVVTANTTTEGTATITATTVGKNAAGAAVTKTIVINVTSGPVAVTGVTVAPTSVTVGVNQTTQLTATIAPANATNQAVTWTSSDNNVATVSPTGLVTAGANAGNATITVTTADGSFTAQCAVTVATGDTVQLNKTLTGVVLGDLEIHLEGAPTTTTITATVTAHKVSDTSIEKTYNLSVANTSKGYPVIKLQVSDMADAISETFYVVNDFSAVSFGGFLPSGTTVKVYDTSVSTTVPAATQN